MNRKEDPESCLNFMNFSFKELTCVKKLIENEIKIFIILVSIKLLFISFL